MNNRNTRPQNPSHKKSAWLTRFALACLCAVAAISASAQTNGTWISTNSSGLWSATSNWLGGQVASGNASANYTAFFNAVDITADPTVVHLDSPQYMGVLVFGDLNPNSAAGWLLDNNGSALNILTLTGQTNIVVNALGAGKQVTISANIAGTTGLKKTGAGTLDLNGGNMLTGGVAVNQGALTLDYSAGATVLGSQALSLGGAALTVQGYSNTPVTQTFTSTLLNAGQNIITAVNGGGTNTTTIVTGGWGNPPSGGVVEFIGPATITNATTTAGNGGGPGTGTSNGVITTTTGTAQQVFNDTGGGTAYDATGYATVGLYDFAMPWGASPFTVVGMSQGTNGSGLTTIITNVVNGTNTYTTNFTLLFGGYQLANGTLPAASSLTSAYDIMGSLTLSPNAYQYGGWRFNANAYSSVTINQVTGASILVTPNVGANNIEIIDGSGVSGALEPGARNGSNAGSLVFWQNNTNGFLQLDNKTLWDGKTVASAFVQAGPGTVLYIGTNGYTGPTYLNNGVSAITSGYSFGTNSRAAGTVYLSGGTIVAATNNVTLDNAGATPRPIFLGNNGGGLGAGSNFTLTVDGVISNVVSGVGPLIIGIPPSSANGFSAIGRIPGTGSNTANLTEWDALGTVLLNGGSNTYSGGVVLYSGVLTYSGASLGTGGYTFSGGTFKWAAGSNLDLSSQTVSLLSGGGTLDLNGTTQTFANSIGNSGPGGLTTMSSTGSGVLNLNVSNLYSGGTTVGSNSTLNVNNPSGSGTGSGPVLVNGTLGGSGTIAGSVTVGTNGMTYPSGGAGGVTTTIGGSITYPVPASSAIQLTNAIFALSANATGQPGATNDQIIMSGAGAVLSPNGTKVGIKCGATLDTNHPYVLYNLTNGGSVSGSFNPLPAWLASTPALAPGFVVGVIGNQVVLEYSLDPIITSASGSVASVVANQNFTVSATVIQGNDPRPVASVTANLSPVGLSSSQAMAPDSTGTNYSVTLPVAYSVNAGTYTLVVTAKDTVLGFATSNLTMVVYAPPAVIGSPASQTWSGKGSDNLWSDAANWTNGLAPGYGDTLFFDGPTDLTPLMNNSYSMAGVTFNSSAGAFNITASGGNSLALVGGVTNLSSHLQTLNMPITLNAATVPVSDAGSGVVLPGVISGASTNSLATSGSVTLGSANTFGGTTVISGGTLNLGNSLSLQNSTLSNVAGSVSFGSLTTATIGALAGSQNLTLKNTTPAVVNLTLGNNSTNAYTGILSDGGLGASLVMSGKGTQTLSGINTYTGPTTINSGATLAIGGSGQLNSGNYASAIANAGTFNYNSSLPQALAGVISGPGVFSQTGAGALTLSAVNTYSGATTIGSNSTLTIGGAGQLGAGSYAGGITDNGTLTYASSQPQTLSGAISGIGGLNQNGPGLLTLSSANTFSGTTVIAPGSTLQLNTGGALQGSTVNYSSGTLTFSGINAAVLGGWSGSQNLVMTNLTGGVVSLTIGGNNSTNTYSGNLSDNGLGATLTKGGGGTETMTGSNNFTGTTYITGGTLRIGDPGQFGSNGVYVGPVSMNGVSFEYASSLTQTFTGQCSGNSSILNITGPGTLVLAYPGSETIMELAGASLGIMNPLGTLIVSNSATINGGGDAQLVTNNGTYIHMSTGNQTLSGVITGNGYFVEDGPGNLTLSGGANPFNGTYQINGGAILIGADTNLGAWPAVPTTNIFLNGGSLYNTGASNVLYANRILGIGPTNGAVGTNGRLDSSGASFIIPSPIGSAGNTGTNGLWINTAGGTNKVILTGTNSFAGNMVISNGTLSISNTGNLNLGNFAGNINIINSTALLSYDAVTPQTLSGAINGNGALAVNGAGPLTLLGANNYGGNTFISSVGTLTVGASGSLGAGSYIGTITNNGTLSFNNPNPGGQSVYEIVGTGQTLINAGDLILFGPSPDITSSNITLGTGATLDVSTYSPYTLTSSQILQGSGTINGSVVVNSGSAVYAGLSGVPGTNTFNNSLTLSAGATAYFTVGPKYNQSNSLIVVGASGASALTLSGNALHVKAPSTSANLDSNDYVLFSVTGSITGSPASSPIWDVAPANPFNYTVKTVGQKVVLHYTSVAVAPPTITASIAPTNLYTLQGGLVTVSIIRGSSPTITSAVLDETPLFGTLTTLPLVSSNSTYIYTNTVTIPNNPLLQGPYTLTVTVTDSSNLTASANISLNVVSGHVWNGGAAPNANWSSGANWVGGVAPDYTGDNVFFDGTVNTLPQVDLDYTYTVGGVSFNPTAGSFTNGPSNHTLVLTGGVTNNSAKTQTMNVNIAAQAPVIFNAATADLVFQQNIDDGGGNVTVIDGGHNTIVQGPISDTGDYIMAGIGTNTLSGTNTYSGNTIISSGTLAIGASGALGPGTYAGLITNNGTLTYNGTNVQTLSGVISGRGSLNVIGLQSSVISNANLILSGANTFTNNVVISNAWVSVTYGPNAAGAATSLGVANLAGRTVTINSNGVLSVDSGNAFAAGGTAVSLGFIINRGGVMQATVANSSIGPVTLNGGILRINGLAASGALQYMPFEFSGSVTVGGTNASIITNTGNASGGINLTVGTGGTGQTTFNVAVTGATNADLTVSLPLANAGGTGASAGLIKAGAGTLALTGTNIYTGVTTLSNGILNVGVAETPAVGGPLGNSAAFNPGSIVFAGGTLQYSAANTNDYSGRFSTAAGQPIVIDTGSQSISFANPLTSPGGSLTKLGTGTLTLTTANTYSGGTVISKGTLLLAPGGSIAGTSNINIAAGAVFNVGASYTMSAANSLTVNSAATASTISGTNISLGSSPITVNYDGSHPALTISSGGTLTLNGNAFIVNGSPLALNSHSVLIQQTSGNVISSGNYTVSGTAIGSGTAGTITVSGGQVTLNIVVGINQSPPRLLLTTSPTSITIGWPTNLGWRLEYQSNTLKTGLLTNPAAWQTWPNSTTVTQMVIPILPTNEIFFQLIYP
jgi:autotransporter-associated beta strand protein